MDNAAFDTRNSAYFFYISVAFVAMLMIANTVAVKLFSFGPFILSAAAVTFPLTYIFGDILTEVYGYRAVRKVIWTAFAAQILMSAAYFAAQALPAADVWTGQEAFASILGFVPRIVLASIVAFFVGEFCNSYVLSRMKVWTEGRHLWLRTIGSTVVGQGADTMLFVFIAFFGTIPLAALLVVMVSEYIFKVGYEVLATPVTYAVVGKLKKAEGIDVYDRDISYNPFHISETA
jgi:uncharacterized integral membrane protein (TIGR00697 family)